MLYPLIGLPQGPEWLVILLIVILVFGATKLPELARGLGQARKEFKEASRELAEEDEKGKVEKPEGLASGELSAADKDRLAELDRREAELKAERERLSGS